MYRDTIGPNSFSKRERLIEIGQNGSANLRQEPAGRQIVGSMKYLVESLTFPLLSQAADLPWRERAILLPVKGYLDALEPFANGEINIFVDVKRCQLRNEEQSWCVHVLGVPSSTEKIRTDSLRLPPPRQAATSRLAVTQVEWPGLLAIL